jgi:multidrug efflux system outer membrane protein
VGIDVQWLLCAALAVSAPGCSLAPEPTPVAPVEELPERFAAEGTPGNHDPLEWWESFEDPVLDRLLDTALVANLDLREATARVEESRALAGVALADLLPQVSGSGEVNRSSNPNNAGFGQQIGELLRLLAGGDSTGDGGGPPDDGEGDGDGGDGDGEDGDADDGPPDRFAQTNYTASLTVAWELDFWGRARNDRAAALQDLVAASADLHAARLSVLAETITAYFDWVDLSRRVRLTEEIVGVLEERSALTETRYDRGLVTSFELYQIRQELQNARAGLPQLRTQLADVERRLALLTGRHLPALRPLLAGGGDPVVPTDPIPAGVPSDLLVQRPDVWAAARRFEAARLRVGARRAELLPGINLSATVGLQAAEAEQLFRVDQWFSNLVAGLTAPLFQGGRLRANLSAAEARYAQQLAVFGRTVLTAIGEAEVALVRYRQELDRFAFLRGQLEEARSSAQLQAERYAAGVSGYPDYLDALRNQLTIESTLAQAGRDLALARLTIHRALGGAWTKSEADDATETATLPTPPDASDAEPPS